MTVVDYILGSVILLFAIIIIAVILLQEGRSKGISGTIAGGADTFFDKNKGRTMEAKLSKITKIVAGVFFVVGLAAVVIFALVK